MCLANEKDEGGQHEEILQIEVEHLLTVGDTLLL